MNGTNQLFVGGYFISVDGSLISANNIASWDGNSWNILGTNSTNNGVNGVVYALAMNGTNQLFVGGQFSSVDGFTEVIKLGVGNGVGDCVGICVGEGVSIFVGCGVVCVLTNLHIHFDLERINQW